MTDKLFQDDAYARTCEARVTGINDRGGIVLDRTVFYATGGGQPGDTGRLVHAGGDAIAIATTVYDSDRATIVHVPAEGQSLAEVGETVTAEIDWPSRYGHMRIHTCLHLLCSIVAYPVTGGQIAVDKGRLDFDIPDAAPDKDELTQALNALIREDRAVSQRWISDQELEAKPELVRTMSVKPPMGSGRVRLIEIADCDLQPCGGTHVATTGEVGEAAVTKIEKKGAQNRRIRIELV